MLKASIASATNAHRLGANEAPPAIISSFLGTQITEILDKFENCSIEDAIEVDDKKRLHLGFGQIPELLLDNTDLTAPLLLLSPETVSNSVHWDRRPTAVRRCWH